MYDIQEDGRWEGVSSLSSFHRGNDPQAIAKVGERFTVSLLRDKLWDLDFDLQESETRKVWAGSLLQVSGSQSS